MIPKRVNSWLESNHHGKVISEKSVSGGCINNGMILQTETGATFFLKLNPSAPSDMFARETEGLATIRVENGPTVPIHHCYDSNFLLLEDLAPAHPKGDYWEDFGRKLAILHQNRGEKFGFSQDNYIGSTPQPNSWIADGYEFFAEHRLRYMARLTRDRGLLDHSAYQDVEKLAGRLAELVPEQFPALLHGDLWRGNAMTDSNGSPAIIDPAAHYGWAEAELAMTTLFGSFPGSFYHAYEEINPLQPGVHSRFPIYNLYHLLNHLYIFGGGYLGQAQAVLRRFV